MLGFILSLITQALFLIFSIINFLIVIYKNIKTKSFYKSMDKWFLNHSLSVDIFGNESLEVGMNTTLRKKGGYNFGKKGETISSALGKNQRGKTLSWVGWFWVYLLWGLDYNAWKKGGHCIASINDSI